MRTYVRDDELKFARADERPDGFRPLACEVAFSTVLLLVWVALGTALLLIALHVEPWAGDRQVFAFVGAVVGYGLGFRHLDYLFVLAGGLHRRRVNERLAVLEAADRWYADGAASPASVRHRRDGEV